MVVVKRAHGMATNEDEPSTPWAPWSKIDATQTLLKCQNPRAMREKLGLFESTE